MSKIRYSAPECRKCGRALKVEQQNEEHLETEEYIPIQKYVRQRVRIDPNFIGHQPAYYQIVPVETGVLCLACAGVLHDSLGKTGS